MDLDFLFETIVVGSVHTHARYGGQLMILSQRDLNQSQLRKECT